METELPNILLLKTGGRWKADGGRGGLGVLARVSGLVGPLVSSAVDAVLALLQVEMVDPPRAGSVEW